MKETLNPTRKRRWRKRIGITSGVLLVLFTIFLFAADGYRRAGMKERRARLQTALDRVETEILKGKTPNQWHESRIKGTNGWEYLQPVFSIDRESEDWGPDLTRDDIREIDSVLNDLSLYYDDERYLNESMYDHYESAYPNIENNGDYEEALLSHWLAKSQVVADRFAKAASCETVVQLPENDEPYPAWDGIRLIPRMSTHAAMMARCKILLDRGLNEQAFQELDNLASVWTSFDAPVFWIDLIVHVGLGLDTAEFALEQLILGKCSPSQVRGLLDSVPNVVPAVLSACEGEAVWMYTAANAADYAHSEPRMFDWLTGDVPADRGLFGLENLSDHRRSIHDRYFRVANITHEMIMAVENATTWVEVARSDLPWDPGTLPHVEVSTMLALYPSRVFDLRNYLILKRLTWLQLELRVLELEAGPLAHQKDVVAAKVGSYFGTRLGWDGDVLQLGISDDLFDTAKQAAATDPANNSHPNLIVGLVGHAHPSRVDGENEWAVRMLPVEKERASRAEAGD